MHVLPRGVDPTRGILSSGRSTRCPVDPGHFTHYTPLVVMIQTESWNDNINVSAEARLYTAIEMTLRLQDVDMLEAEGYVGWVEGYASRLRRNILKHELRTCISKKRFSNGIFLPLFFLQFRE